MTPVQFRLLDKEQKAELTGLYLIEKEIDNYNNSEQMKRIDRDRKN